MARDLTPKQQRFVDEYLVDLNATQAAIRAGYSAKTAAETGYENLRKPQIADAIKAELKSRGERTKATADEVLRELTRLAMFDPVDFTKVRSLADVAKLPEDVRRAIVGWSWNKQGKFMIKLAKEGALEMLGRHHGVFKDGLPRGPLLLANVNLTPAERAQLVSQALADF